jgi:hypothetical protein
LLAYTADLQRDMSALRALLSEALTMMAQQRDVLARRERTIEALRRERARVVAA